MSKKETSSDEVKNFLNTPSEELNLEILQQVGMKGGSDDYRKETNFVPSYSTKGRRATFKSALIEKGLEDYTDEDLLAILPKSFRDKGFTVDHSTLKFNQTDKYIASEGEVVTLTSFTYSPKPPSLYDDMQEVYDLIDKAKAPKKIHKKKKGKKERVLTVLVGDFQIGQADADGATGIVSRVLQMSALIKEEIRKNKVLGTPITKIVFCFLGDLVEGVAHFYNTQTFSVTLDRRDQVKVARRLSLKLIMDIAELGIPMVVATVPGNHGENRNVGGAFTSINDNDDVAVMEQNSEALALNPEKFSHVEFVFPHANRLSLTIKIAGHAVGLVHGHQAGSPKNLGASIRNYLNGQSRAQEAIGSVRYFFMGHFHHYYCEMISAYTTVVMNGAMCKDSDFFAQRFGMNSKPCFVTGVITPEGDEGFIPHILD